MFAKPFSLILVYIVTIFNITILASPMFAMLVPFVSKHGNSFVISGSVLTQFKAAGLILLFLVSFVSLLYMLLDFLFGFAMRASLKGCKRYEEIPDYDFLAKIFDEVKGKFAEKSVKLYVKDSDEINAYAISSLRGKAIVLTEGLINHYLEESESPKEFLYGLRSIMGHEMSHLVNKDFLPTFLILANQKATSLVSYIVDLIFNIVARVLRFVPFGGRTSAGFMIQLCNILDVLINIFNRLIVSNVYEFLRRFVSRSIEYRCDAQSAQAFGGANMAFALSFLGESGYFTLFSTHPKTMARIKKVENIQVKEGVIFPRFVDAVSNYFAIMLLPIFCLFLAKQAGIDLFLREYIHNHEAINQKIWALGQMVKAFF